jgi:acyl dehydratase
VNNGFGKFYEEFEVGDVYKHWPGKTILESDNNLFALLTMNHHPVHLDVQFAKSSQHKKILVVGTYVLSLAIGMSVKDTSGKAIANLGYEEIIHLAPTFIGDTLYAQSEVLEKVASKTKTDRGVVKLKITATNQNGVVVLTLKRKILTPRMDV